VSKPKAPDPSRTDPAIIRNFCIIAHIDHGKSTLADRMLQITGVVDERLMRAQYLDRMDIERERGITIKSQAVRLPWVADDGRTYVLNMIDTPGHVDFTYEVSRSLAACEGTVLLVDAAQGIEAQTLANLYLALENDLQIIPVLNKIDLPAAQPEKYAAELAHIIGCDADDVLRVSAKTGDGRRRAAQPDRARRARTGRRPRRARPRDHLRLDLRLLPRRRHLRARHRRQLSRRERIAMLSTKAHHELLEIGVISPEPKASDGLGVGEVGYLMTGVKDVRQSKVGDTVTSARHPATEMLGGYKDPKPMVFSGLYPIDGDDYPELRDALDKLQLNDAALAYEPETSAALGFGFRCGFLGLLHLEIVRERLEREFNLDLISTAPNVIYRVVMEDGTEHTVTNPSEFPTGKIDEVYEPVVKSMILAPSDYIGTIMELCQTAAARCTHGLPLRGPRRAALHAAARRDHLRLLRPAEVAHPRLRLARLRAGGGADRRPGQGRHPAAGRGGRRVQRDRAQGQGLRVRRLDDRQAAQAHPAPAVRGADPGGDRSRIIARENISAIRKDVLAKCYGGDITRKRKLLEKQKEGKKRMKMVGRVEVPQEAFIAALSTSGRPPRSSRRSATGWHPLRPVREGGAVSCRNPARRQRRPHGPARRGLSGQPHRDRQARRRGPGGRTHARRRR
jgi:GTP-binding protein LepA